MFFLYASNSFFLQDRIPKQSGRKDIDMKEMYPIKRHPRVEMYYAWNNARGIIKPAKVTAVVALPTCMHDLLYCSKMLLLRSIQKQINLLE